MDLKYEGLYQTWPFINTWLVKDKTMIGVKFLALHGNRGTHYALNIVCLHVYNKVVSKRLIVVTFPGSSHKNCY
jgi:hypothetical protein